MKKLLLLLLTAIIPSICFGMKSLSEQAVLNIAHEKNDLKSMYAPLIPVLTDEDAQRAVNLLSIDTALLKPEEKQLIFFKWCLATLSEKEGYDEQKILTRVNAYRRTLDGDSEKPAQQRLVLYKKLDSLLIQTDENSAKKSVLALLAALTPFCKTTSPSHVHEIASLLMGMQKNKLSSGAAVLLDSCVCSLTSLLHIEDKEIEAFVKHQEDTQSNQEQELSGLSKACYDLLLGFSDDELLVLVNYANDLQMKDSAYLVLLLRQALTARGRMIIAVPAANNHLASLIARKVQGAQMQVELGQLSHEDKNIVVQNLRIYKNFPETNSLNCAKLK